MVDLNLCDLYSSHDMCDVDTATSSIAFLHPSPSSASIAYSRHMASPLQRGM